MNGSGEVSHARILVVCTANICRSAAAELILRRRLAETGASRIEVTSAGLNALVDHPIDSVLADLLAEDGIDASRFRARPLAAEQVENATLVLAATRQHRSEILKLAPRSLSKTFTLLEFSSLLGQAQRIAPAPGADQLGSLIKAAAAARPFATFLGAQQDIEDPHRRPRFVYRRVYRQITAALNPIAAALGPQE